MTHFLQHALRVFAGYEQRLFTGIGSVAIRQVENAALVFAINESMRLIDKRQQIFGMPVIPAGFSRSRIHALLYNAPFPQAVHYKVMLVKLEPILYRSVV